MKCRGTLFEGACESHVGLSMCDNPMEGGSLLKGEVAWDRVAYWLQRCQ